MKKSVVSLIDYVYLIVKWRKLIIFNFFIICFVVAIYSLIMPKTYTATTVLMPPKSTGNQNLLGMISNLPIDALGFGMDINQQSYTYLAILNSRTVAVKVIEEFKLMKRFQVRKLDEAIEMLKNKVNAEIRDDGLISLSVNVSTGYFSNNEEENDIRNLAANMANFFIQELNKLNISMQTSEARYNRIFIEKRYNENKFDLKEAERKLKQFQEKYNAISLPDQLQAAIKTAAEIKAQIIADEVELRALKSQMNEHHPEIKKIQIKINQLESALQEMKNGDDFEKSSLVLFPSFSIAPELGVQLIRLTREMEIQNALYEFLTQQYEQAKIQEAKDTPTIQVLDYASPPEFRSKPIRSLMVIFSGFASILFSLFFFTGR